jgi:hypothetical protein
MIVISAWFFKGCLMQLRKLPLVTVLKPNFSPCNPYSKHAGWLLFFILLYSTIGFGQDTITIRTRPCVQTDLQEIVRKWRHKPPPKKVNKNHSLLLIPSAGANPSSGFMLGAAGQYVTREKRKNSLYSFIQGNVFITTKKQLLLQAKSNIYAHNDRILLTGDWRFFIFSQNTYGLSTSAPENGTLKRQYDLSGFDVGLDSLVQPMKFNHLRFYQTVSWKIKEQPLYIGAGYHLDFYSNITDNKLDTANKMLTSHYLYSTAYGYNQYKYAVSGISANITGDSRDNQVNARKGYFFNINWRLNPHFLGSTHNSTQLNLEWRSFHSVSKTDNRKTVGFWFIGNFSQAGKLPYLALPSLGYDQRGRAGRGYTQGRFRGPNMLYAESEYRFPISDCGGIFSGVAFVNITTADNAEKSVKLFQNVAPGIGAGLRIMVDKLSKTNLQIDFGVGRKSVGVYIGVAETF